MTCHCCFTNASLSTGGGQAYDLCPVELKLFCYRGSPSPETEVPSEVRSEKKPTLALYRPRDPHTPRLSHCTVQAGSASASPPSHRLIGNRDTARAHWPLGVLPISQSQTDGDQDTTHTHTPRIAHTPGPSAAVVLSSRSFQTYELRGERGGHTRRRTHTHPPSTDPAHTPTARQRDAHQHPTALNEAQEQYVRLITVLSYSPSTHAGSQLTQPVQAHLWASCPQQPARPGTMCESRSRGQGSRGVRAGS